jgi:hypothetical protein
VPPSVFPCVPVSPRDFYEEYIVIFLKSVDVSCGAHPLCLLPRRVYPRLRRQWVIIDYPQVHATYTHLDECLATSKGTVRVPSVAPGHGYCLKITTLQPLLLKTCQPSELPGLGRASTPSASIPPGAGIISMPDFSVSVVYAARRVLRYQGVNLG